MKVKKFLLGALGLAVAASAFADEPFRQHRYDSFKVTPTEEGQIMFVGNSITNMHSWFEAFGSHQEVVGRGNSGGFTTEVLANLESYIDSKPAKLFLMIGTNDISSGVSAGLNATRVQAIVKRVRLESPETEIYLETILPRSSNPKPDYEQNNTILKEWVAQLNDPKVHIVNLSEVCAPINGNGTWSHDGLHPRPIGYAAWCHEIEDEVGYPTVYPQTITSQESCGLSGSPAGRVEQFPYFPVSEGDVLFFGDEQVHGAEWHELLRSDKIKDRGEMWGWGGIGLDKAKNVVKSALKDQAHKPAKIFLFYGVGGKDATNYRALVDEAKTQAPDAKIYLVSLSPSTNAATNTENVNFNTLMQTVATEKGATYVDVYTPLNANLSQNIMNTNYISGRGYIVMANELAKYLTEEGVNPVTMAEANALIESRNNRAIVGNALTNYFVNYSFGDAIGQVPAEYEAQMTEPINQLVAAVNSADLTAASAQAAVTEFNAKLTELNQHMNMPVASTEGNEVWYRITSARGNRSVSSQDGLLCGTTPSAASTLSRDIWKLVERDDNTFDIVNKKGEYISPVANYDAQMTVTETRPEAGFSISYSNNGTGYFTIYTSNLQLNQTNNQIGSTGAYKIYNWYNKQGGATTPDRADQGCAYSFTLFEGRVLDGDLMPTTGWYTIKGETGAAQVADKFMVNADAEYRQTAANYYALELLDAAPANEAVGFIHITIDGNNWQFTGLNGHGIKENCTSDRASLSTDYTAVTIGNDELHYAFGKWAHYAPGDGHTYVGKSSGSNNTYRIARVSDETLAGYDIWNVTIIGNNAAEVGNDLRVSLDIPQNKGITTVYNGGTFFVEAGTAITEDMLTFVPAEDVTQELETPEVDIDNANHTIMVKYKDTNDGAILTVLNKSFTTNGEPYRVPDDIAAPVLASTANTAAFNLTINGNPATFAVYAGATNTTHAGQYFTTGNLNDGRVGVRYIGNQGTEGWYTRAHQGGTKEVKVVFVNDPETGYTYYVNGALLINIPATGLGAYGHVHYGNVPDADALYLGGIVTSADAAKFMLNGTIHSARFWDRALTADEVANLNYDFLSETKSDSQVGITEIDVKPAAPAGIYDLQGRRVAKPAHGLYIVNGRKVIL